MANSLNGATRKLLDGKLTLYLRPNSSFWWAGFYRDGKHVRFSTQSPVLAVAETRATQWYYQQQLQTAASLAKIPRAQTLHQAVNLAIAQYTQDAAQGRRSERYVVTMNRQMARLTQLLPDMALAQVNQSTWNLLKQQLLHHSPSMAAGTLHRYQMALRIVLNEAVRNNQLTQAPRLLADFSMRSTPTPRTWFELAEYQRLVSHLRMQVECTRGGNAAKHQAALELLDYVEFVVASGLRLGEAHNVRFCDVCVIGETAGDEQRQCLLIRNIKGKRGRDGSCKTHWDAVAPFLRSIERRGVGADWHSSEKLVFEKPRVWQFVKALRATGLRYTQHRPPRRRDLMSLRHTYICFRLLEQVPVFNIAINCRTSVSMIERHYARYLSVEGVKVNGTVSVQELLGERKEDALA